MHCLAALDCLPSSNSNFLALYRDVTSDGSVGTYEGMELAVIGLFWEREMFLKGREELTLILSLLKWKGVTDPHWLDLEMEGRN